MSIYPFDGAAFWTGVFENSHVENGRGPIIPYIAGHPLTIYVGFVLFAFLLATFILGLLLRRRKIRLSFKYHRNLAMITMFIATFHGVLATIDRFFTP